MTFVTPLEMAVKRLAYSWAVGTNVVCCCRTLNVRVVTVRRLHKHNQSPSNLLIRTPTTFVCLPLLYHERSGVLTCDEFIRCCASD